MSRHARLLPLVVALGVVLPAHAQDARRADVAGAALRLQGQVVEWRRDIHQHPELGNRETRTAALVADHLRKLGLEPKTGIATTGVTAVLKGGKPGPRIALRADMDALPVTERSGLPFESKATAQFRGEFVVVGRWLAGVELRQQNMHATDTSYVVPKQTCAPCQVSSVSRRHYRPPYERVRSAPWCVPAFARRRPKSALKRRTTNGSYLP